MEVRRSKLTKLVTGGQTGVDRAALDVCLALGITCGGWCPQGRIAEDGRIDPKYPLQETPSNDVSQRTEWNVRDSDGTLILTLGEPKDGTILTAEMAQNYNKPLMLVKLEEPPEILRFQHWLNDFQIEVLNVAGPRESLAPGRVYRLASVYLKILLDGTPAL